MHRNKEYKIEKRVAVKRLAAKRCDELLCIIGADNSDDEDAEWIDREAVFDENLDLEKFPDDVSTEGTLEIESLDDWLSSPWTEDTV